MILLMINRVIIYKKNKDNNFRIQLKFYLNKLFVSKDFKVFRLLVLKMIVAMLGLDII